MHKLDLVSLFCIVDDYFELFLDEMQKIQLDCTPSTHWWTTRKPGLTLSEIATIVCWFHQSRYRTFKDLHLFLMLGPLRALFPKAPSYSRFITLMKTVIFPLFLMQYVCKGHCQGIAFIDSTVLSVCHIYRASSHKTFRKIAAKGKTSTGWFYGLKLHIVVNHKGEILAWMLTPGNVFDLQPVETLSEGLFGKLVVDKGYISKKLFDALFEKGLQLVTRLRANMKNYVMDLWDKILLRKRGIVESVINQLKHGCQIEHHRHRSPLNFLVNLVAGLTTYSINPQKPSVDCFVMT